MRHATCRGTLETYSQTRMQAKREAQRCSGNGKRTIWFPRSVRGRQ